MSIYLRFTFLCIGYFLHTIAYAQNAVQLQGTVTDASTGRLIPFVYVIINNGIIGSSTDLDGKFNFEIKIPIEKITFTHVGYADFVYEVKTSNDLMPLKRFLQIPLSPIATELPETVLTSGNPAHRLIKKALANRGLHNPKTLPYYSYNSYNKFFVNLEPSQDTRLPPEKDSADRKLALFLQKSHLFLAETVTNYQYRAPTYQYEKVIANRVSGLLNPQFVALSTQGQLLNFYEDYFTLLNRKYLNPISAESWKRYEFTIEDTVFLKPDTLFWIAFEPLPNKFFDGLKGRLAIHTRTFAIQSMDIESALPEKEVGLGFRLEQQNEWVNNAYWFPKQLRTELMLRRVKVGEKRMIAQWRTHLSDIDFKTKPAMRNFVDVSLDVNPDAHLQGKELWATYRTDTLNKKELNSYIILDSLGKKAGFDKTLMLSQYLTFLRVPINRWKVDLDLKQTFNFNQYEQFRLGAGFITNQLFSKRYTIGTYLAYGTRDGNFKYGFSAQYNPFQHIDASIAARYVSDVYEPGRVRFMEESTGFPLLPNRAFPTRIMDKVRQFEFKIQGRPLQNIRLAAFFRTQRILPTYAYSFAAHEFGDYYQLTELNFQVQYFFGAQFIRMGNSRNLAAIRFPMLQASYTQGLRALGSHFRYGKWEARLVHEHTFRQAGTLHGELWFGFAKGDIPYHALWNGQGTGKPVPRMIPTFMQTMGLYEFLNDRFAFVFLSHNFRKLLYKSPYKWLQPEPVFHQNFAWGNLRNPTEHQGITTNTLNKGYWESGFMLNNLIKFKYMKSLKIGLGGGVFFRYGYYHRDKFSENVAYKFSFSIGV